MGFIGYTFLGGIAYALGWATRAYVIDKKTDNIGVKANVTYGFTHPVIMSYMAGFFVVMLVVSALIGRFVLGHTQLDIAYIVVNALVATFVFSFGINPDKSRYDVPD